ncbi:hypothetical protein PILCRDRAFT_2015 [Piloderma croceum F 1598]|uniref:Uncharacterized protein n=1 Tax=Piloderma croceum (strain F 1598) TaxID=765440 RepID=A0A0C3BT45_PILCF|nr:hypothetical protein PILCRDRAFT_2015 [Piloderma croceum F 1598]
MTTSPKSGNDWGKNELLAYNIDVQFQDAATFFGVNPLPQPAVANEVLTRLNADDMTRGVCCGRFAVCLLTLLGYVPRPRMTRTRTDNPVYHLRRAMSCDVLVGGDKVGATQLH